MKHIKRDLSVYILELQLDGLFACFFKHITYICFYLVETLVSTL